MNPPETAVEVTRELLLRYDRPAPRYTSYPTAPEWREDFTDQEYRTALADAAARPDEPLSLYIHVPFCHERCAFCGCNVVISRKEGVADKYLGYVDRELAMAAQALAGRSWIKQLHWGGGTPTYLSPEQIRQLFGSVARHFTVDAQAETALEVDPRVTTREQVETLRELGFNRVSMGVQDLDPQVQCEIHRNQSEEETRRLFTWCREVGFQGINIDLIYGLPGQRLDTWTETIHKIIDIHPDRLAIYSYAYLPAKLHNQRHIDVGKLPTGPEKYDLIATARKLLLAAGYEAIGMDHFAVSYDELAVAMHERRLHRNFMGYTVVPAAEMVSFGTSAISEVGGVYAQNEKKLSRYYAAIDEGRFPTASGCHLSADDRVRAWVIRQLMCNFYLDTQELGKRFGVAYETYFASEEHALREYYEQGFLARENGNLKVLALGQVFIRNVATVFDAYLQKTAVHHAFSRSV
ncbi:MAG: oxygen-independent coproporphyrinogen III oxidase [Candidatus Hydrogenedentes bacterium]|nr:oxygen-independent coproporphyrinogen III oxidase [Candidatus Hydrogenedentota bacterium]